MKYDNLEPWQYRDIERRLLKKWGEIVEVNYTDLEEVERVEEDEVEVDASTAESVHGKKKAHREWEREREREVILVPVERQRKFYIGRMGAGETGSVVAILGALFTRGLDYKELSGQKHNLTFLEVLDEHHVTLLLSVILATDGSEQDWVKENYDLDWVTDVMRVWLKYNNFLNLIQKITGAFEGMGITEDKVRSLATGETSLTELTRKTGA